MRVRSLRKSAGTRIAVKSLLVVFTIFGASFAPPPKVVTPSPANIQISRPTISTGLTASAELDKYLSTHEQARAIRAKILEKLRNKGVSEAHMILMRGKSPMTSLLEARANNGAPGLGTAHAQEIVMQNNESLFIITPYEADGNEMTAEFNAWYLDYATGVSSYADLRVGTEDPLNDIQVLDGYVGCDLRPEKSAPAVASIADLISPRAHAQTTYKGIDCRDTPAINATMPSTMREAFRNAVIGVAGAAGPCIGATIGWWLCVGLAGIGAYWGTMGYEALIMIYDCRCWLFKWDCPQVY